MSDGHLFPLPPAVPGPPPKTPGQRLTDANRRKLEQGIHPATHRPTTDEGRCGTCAHHVIVNGGARDFHKCEHHRLGPSHSANSDIRTSWPSCTLFERVTSIEQIGRGRIR